MKYQNSTLLLSYLLIAFIFSMQILPDLFTLHVEHKGRICSGEVFFEAESSTHQSDQQTERLQPDLCLLINIQNILKNHKAKEDPYPMIEGEDALLDSHPKTIKIVVCAGLISQLFYFLYQLLQACIDQCLLEKWIVCSSDAYTEFQVLISAGEHLLGAASPSNTSRKPFTILIKIYLC